MSNRLSIQSYLFILFFFSAHHISAEGSKEMSPNGSITILGNNTTDIAALHINSDSYNNFASYNNQDDTSRLHIHIADPQNEIIYLGFSNGHLNQSVIDPTELDFEYRIKDPNGNIVFGPVKICAGETGPGIIDDWLQGNSGPIQLGNTDGYFALTVNSSDLMSAGWTGKGDYYIEFDAGDTNFLIDFWDISVVDRSNGALTEKKGRVWSFNWAIFAVNDFGFPERPFNGAFYICSPDLLDPDAAFITKIDFNGSDFRPAAFNIAFNSFGSMNTGDIAMDRQSVNGDNLTTAEYAIFLNDPVDICNTAMVGSIEFTGIDHCAVDEYCINFFTNRIGQVSVLVDLDGPDGEFTPGTQDVLLVQNVDSMDIGAPICLPWNGVDGLGNPVTATDGLILNVSIDFNQGVTHFPIYDAELMLNGFNIEAVRPAGPQPKLYYDDSNIPDDSGTADPNVELAGCELPCHRWSNFDFGNMNTINSWWFSQQTNVVAQLEVPPVFFCEIIGLDEICEAQETELSIEVSSDQSNAIIPDLSNTMWSGPSIVGSNLGTSIIIDQPGTYSATFDWTSESGDQCAHNCTKNINALPTIQTMRSEEICQGDSIVINGEVYNTEGVYEIFLPTMMGCDTVITLDLQVTDPAMGFIAEQICENTSITINGQDFDTAGSYQQTLSNNMSCDSILNIEISLLPNSNDSIEEEICQGETVEVNGEVYDAMGIYQQTLTGVNGCDSILNITVVELPLNNASLDLEICQGSSIDVNGEIYDAMGIYQQTLIGANGCDSILTITIEELISSVSNLDLEVCQGESVDVNGELYDQMGSYQQTLMGSNGCDSLLMIEISELTNTSETIEAKICEDATIQINDEVYNATGTYEQVLINNSGCDSILTIEIEAFPIAAETVQGEFCQGDSFEINNEQFDAPGVYEQVLISAEGCDSILTIELEALPLNLDSLNAQICNDESITVNGETYDVPGSYTQIRSAQMGCDTLLTIDVEILPDSEEIIFEDLCEGEEVEYNGQTYAMAGSYEQELIASNGCDSTLTIEIRILPNYEVCDTITLYEGEEVVVNGEVYNQPGTYQQLLQTVDGCDSLINIKIGIIILSEALVYYSLNDCKAGGASFEEFIPEYTSDYECSIIDASLLYRPSGFLHSCTPGMDESSGMCISSLESCEFDQESEYKLVFEVDITPIDSATIISGISFFEKAPFMFEYEIGTTGLNNYPTLYSIRILRDGIEVFADNAVPTNRDWTLQNFELIDIPEMRFAESGTLTVELLPYCTAGVDAFVTAWDIDDIKLNGFCKRVITTLNGSIMSRSDEAISNVEMTISHEEMIQSFMTDDSGHFLFEGLKEHTPYYLTPYKNDDPLNGVSTLDLVIIQKHILGIETISEFENLLAADVNNSKLISTIDLIELRKLILGIHDEIPNNTSWRFLDPTENYENVSDVNDTFVIEISEQALDLRGVKIGDVNNSARSSFTNSTVENRNEESLVFNYLIDDKISDATTSIKFYAQEEMILNGFQMELVLEEIESIQVVNHAIEINEGNYNILENNLRLSWNENIDLIKEGELLFELLLSNQSFNNFDLNAHFANELYIGDLLEIANLKLVPVVQPIGSANEVKFESINIAPNPFESTARFSFESIIEENVELKIFDLNGQLISNKVVPVNIGLNSVELHKSDFGKSGVYMISFQSGTTRLSRKITIL